MFGGLDARQDAAVSLKNLYGIFIKAPLVSSRIYRTSSRIYARCESDSRALQTCGLDQPRKETRDRFGTMPIAREKIIHARRDLPHHRLRLLCRGHALRCRLRAALRVRETPMIFDYALGAAVTLGLLAYLVFALIRPERF